MAETRDAPRTETGGIEMGDAEAGAIAPAPAPRAGVGHHERPLLGIALRIVVASSYGMMAALLKLANQRGVAASELVFYRSLFGLPIVVMWIWLGPGFAAIRTRRPFAHVLRSTLGVVAIQGAFAAVTLLSLADATTIGFTAPIFSTILSALLLRERVGPHRWAAVILGFIGIIIVMRPGGTMPSPLGLSFAFAGAMAGAGVVITLRQIGATEHVAATVFWFFIVSLIFGAVLVVATGHSHPIGVLAILAGAGLLGGILQIASTASLRFAPVGLLVPFDYVQIVWAIGLGWVMFNSPPTLATLAGGALIISSGLYTIWREQRRRRTSAAPAAGAPAATG